MFSISFIKYPFKNNKKINLLILITFIQILILIPEPTARSAVRRGLLIPLGYLHPGKCEHSEVQSHPPL